MSSKEISKGFALTGLANVFSRASGLFRDMILAYVFGASAILDTFLLAFTFPNLSRRVFGEGAMNSAMVPVLGERNQVGEERTHSFISNILSCVFVLLLVCSVLLSGGALLWGSVLGTGGRLPYLLAVLFPYMIAICLVALGASVLQFYKDYFLASFVSVFLNIFMVLSLGFYVLFDKRGQLVAEGYLLAGVLVSGLFQLGLIYGRLRRLGVKLEFLPNFRSRDWQSVKLLFVPALLGAGVGQLGVLSDRVIATFIGESAVSSLYYSERLTYLPVGIFAVALGVVCLPVMSRARVQGDKEELEKAFCFSLRIVFFLSFFIVAFLALCSRDVLSLLFKQGQFGEKSLSMTAMTLLCYLPGIPFFCALKVILPLYHSKKEVKFPVKVASICFLMNVVVGLSLIPWFSQGALALATSLSSALNCIVLLVVAFKGEFPKWKVLLLWPLLRLLACAVFAYFLSSLFFSGASYDFSKVELSYRVFIRFVVVLFLYIGSSTLLRGRELQELLSSLKAK